MSFLTRQRLVNPRLGVYTAIFTSTFIALVMLAIVFEQLGRTSVQLMLALLTLPVILYAAIAAITPSAAIREYYAAGRRVPAIYAGLVLSVVALGGIGLVTIPGLVFHLGFDALFLVTGIPLGMALAGILVVPYFRKAGSYTLPGFLGERYKSRIVRVAAAAFLMLPLLLLIVAELRIGTWFLTRLVNIGPNLAIALLLFACLPCILIGGMRSLIWTGGAKAIVALLSFILPLAALATLSTNLPVPQLSYGSVLRGFARVEATLTFEKTATNPLSVSLPGTGVEVIQKSFLAVFGVVGPHAYLILMLLVALGIASSPILLARITTTLSVFDSRKAIGWSTCITGLALLSLVGVAVFYRDIVVDEIIRAKPDALPAWFSRLRDLGFATLSSTPPRITFSDVGFARDSVLFSLPIATRFPEGVLAGITAGVLAATLAALAASISALANIVAEDGVLGLRDTPPADVMRLLLARLTALIVAAIAGWLAFMTAADPLHLFLSYLALTGATFFPALVVGIWWKRSTVAGALAGMTAGFTVSAGALVVGLGTASPAAGLLMAALGVPAGFAANLLLSRLTPRPQREVLELVRDMRIPGGETMHDREERMMKPRTGESA